MDNEDEFHVSGPKHMTSRTFTGRKIVTDWKNPEHRRCVAACLVKACSVIENDRTKCRLEDNKALAPPWWESFGFTLKKVFKTDSKFNDHFTYGAVFEQPAPSRSAPKYVFAFRGAMLFHPKVLQDLMQDTLVLFNALAGNRRFKRTRAEVDELISNAGGTVWLGGHSLGASLALEIARNIMLEKGLNVPTFLFNPPHVSPAPVINKVLRQEEHKTGLYTGIYALKYALANVLPWRRKHTKELFEKLSPWEPELYVNPEDAICRGYIDYFVHWQRVSENHPRFASTAARTSYRDVFFFRTLRPHLLPSARLWTNTSNKMEPHGLRQWWKPDSDLELSNTHYVYPLEATA